TLCRLAGTVRLQSGAAVRCRVLVRPLRFRQRFLLSSPPRKRTGRMIGVDEDTAGRSPGLGQSEATRRHAVLEQPLSFAEPHRKYPDAILVDEVGSDQRLQQFAAAPDMQRRPL